MTINELEQYIKLEKTATVPQIQSKFGIKYGEAREAFRTLEKEGKIKFTGGVTFEWCAYEPSEVALEQHRKELQERLARLRDMRMKEAEEENDLLDLDELFDDDDDEDDDVSDGVEWREQTPRTMVELNDVLKSDSFRKSKARLAVALGRDGLGNDIVVDLAEMPHLLIAGATGAGKSMILNDIILSLAQKYSPEHVRMVLVDPKFVEFSRYKGLAHLLTNETVTATDDVFAALDYLIDEMESRYMCFREQGVCNLAEYNKKAEQKLPYLVFMVDELADVMYEQRRKFEIKLNRLAQKSRASGIHIVLATQRPDVSTVTGTVKANIPARIALAMNTKIDSVVVINRPGAEQLLGKGDMLYLDAASAEPKRAQGCYVSHDDINEAVIALKKKYPAVFDEDIANKIFVSSKRKSEEDEARAKIELDPLCKKALRFWLEKQSGRASIASIQRNLGIGFNRAGRIMDSLQKLGYVEEVKPGDSSIKPVMVLITLGDLDRLFPDQED